jgi:hypothetical protein
VTINGGNFTAGSTIRFGTTSPTSTTFVSPTQLRVTAPAHIAGVVHATVTNGVGGSFNGNADLYAFGPPTISSFTPTSGITGSSVTITGTNLVPGTKVKVGGLPAPAVTFLSPTQITAIVPSGALTASISLGTAAGTATSAAKYTVTFAATAFSPTSGPAGTPVTVAGVGFNASSIVKFNGSPATTTNSSSTQLQATVPTGAATGPITVTNTTAPTGTIRSSTNYTVSPT